VSSFTEKGPGYGIPAESVDGTDVLAVYETTKRAVDAARAGEGVHLIEMRYYRRKGHAQHDPQDYVDPAEIAEWEARDPILRFKNRLLEEGWAADDDLAEIDRMVAREVDEAAEAAIRDPLPVGAWAVEEVYTDAAAPMPWTRA
jgi:TPP-dependent pyruvate/acetoin dehydrogenase alpha subunit